MFGLALASSLNFLAKQARLALAPGTPASHREWAEREIDEALSLLPSPSTLERILSIAQDR